MVTVVMHGPPRDIPTRPADVIGFNAMPFIMAPIGGLVGMAMALAPLPPVLRVASFVAGCISREAGR